jgi:hypothetical protein
VQPSTFSSVLANQQQNVRIAFSIPSTADLGTYEGTIHIKVGTRTLPQTLKTTISVVTALTPEQTFAELADELIAGDIEAALQNFSPSPLNRDTLTSLDPDLRSRFAATLQQARLVAEKDNTRTYQVPSLLGTAPSRIMMLKTDLGNWTIISW